MKSLKSQARTAGLLYLIMGITGAFGLMYVPSKIVVTGDATTTAYNITHSAMLFRAGIFSNLICQVSFVFLVLSLKRLFKGVSKSYNTLMVTLVTVAVPIAFLLELNQLAALHLLSGADYLNALAPGQIKALALFFIDLHNQGIAVVGIFWGLWLFPFGYLIVKSGFIPKILGILLMIGCFSYLIDSATALLFPQHREAVASIIMLPMALGELSVILWLLIAGAKQVNPSSAAQ